VAGPFFISSKENTKMAERYKITNTTQKPPRLVNGVDTRKKSEQVGHFIEFHERDDEKSPRRLVPPGKFAIIGYLNEWFLEQERKGELKIDIVKDMGSALKEFRHSTEEQVAKPAPKQLNLKINEMGKSPTVDEDHMVNPAGEPNYIVKAPKGIGSGATV
jgi:hypothetical protein